MSRKYGEEYDNPLLYYGNAFAKLNHYKNSKTSFLKVLQRWIPERRHTLMKLQELLKEVHNEALKFNETKASCKELSYNSRTLKSAAGNEALDFFSSLGAFFGDFASGLAAVAEACNTDSHQTKLNEILDHDRKITKELYTARSRCMTNYQGIEEVIRHSQSATFTTTVEKIKNTLSLDKHWAAIEKSKDDTQFSNAVGKFLETVSKPEALDAVGSSVYQYFNDNPAVLEACASTGKAVFGAMSMMEENKKGALKKEINSAANLFLMMDDKNEVDRLTRVVKEDTIQNKLECKIKDVIEELEKELEELNKVYLQLQTRIVSDSD